MADHVIAGIDVGSSSVKIAVAEMAPQKSQAPALHLLGIVEHPMEGMQKGVVANVDDVVSSLSAALEKAERLIGVPVSHATVSIGSPQIFIQPSRGVVAVSKVNGEVKEEDIDRVIDAAQTITTPANYEILHILPRSFTVDGQSGVVDPVGMVGTRLEVDAEMVYVPATQLRNLTKAVYRTGCEIDDVVLGILACAEGALEKRQKDVGVALVNIGSSTTSLVVFEEGNVIHAGIVALGGNHITGDLAIGLRTSLDVAEKVKREVASAESARWGKRDEFQWEEVGETGIEGGCSKKTVAEITEARVEELFELIDEQLKKIDRSGMLPGGIVITGSGALVDGTVSVAKRVLRLPACYADRLGVALDGYDGANLFAFSQVLGLLLWSSKGALGSGGWKRTLSSVATKLGGMSRSLLGRMKPLFPW